MVTCYTFELCKEASTIWKRYFFLSVLFYHYYSISPCHFLCFTADNIFISFIFGWLGFIVFLTTLHFLLPPNSFTTNWATSGANADASTGRKPPCYPLLFPIINRLFLINGLLILGNCYNTFWFVYRVLFVIHYETFIR